MAGPGPEQPVTMARLARGGAMGDVALGALRASDADETQANRSLLVSRSAGR